MSDKLRTFVALEVPPAVGAQLAELQRSLAGYRLPVRWVSVERIHLTLKFLGDTAAEDVDGIGAALESAAAGCGALRLRAAGLGLFPNPRRPRVLWVGVRDERRGLPVLWQAVEQGLAFLGWAPEKRPFRSHLTIGRFKGAVDSRRLTGLLIDRGRFQSDAFAVDRLHLFKSRLTPSGAVYTKLYSAALAAPTPGP